MNIWQKAQSVELKVDESIPRCFNIRFDKKIAPETESELRSFVSWVESRYHIPIELWVDFEYKHYLIRRDGKRVGYIFYWADFNDRPVFSDPEDVPCIILPVRTEHSSIEEILASFIEAISCYFAWICGEITEGCTPDYDDVEEILQEYLAFRKK